VTIYLRFRDSAKSINVRGVELAAAARGGMSSNKGRALSKEIKKTNLFFSKQRDVFINHLSDKYLVELNDHIEPILVLRNR
jgi:hypothetical protein